MTNQEFIESITLDGEVWKPVTGFENLYCISSYGRVVSLEKYVSNRFQNVRKEQKLMVPHIYSDGRKSVTLSKNGVNSKKHLSRFVASEFIPNPNGYTDIDHINTNKEDNSVTNLRWCNQSMNMNNPITRAKIQASIARGDRKGSCHRQVVQLKDGDLIKTFKTASNASRSGFEGSCIRDCCNGRSKSHRGFQWMYKDDYDNLLSKKSKNSLISDAD